MTPKAKLSPRDEESIQHRNQEFAAAWNRHDTHAMSVIFAEDGDLINPFGQQAQSRAEIEKLVTGEHAGPLKTSQLSMKQERVRLLAPDVAVVDSSYAITGAKSPSGKEVSIQGHLTQVFRKQGETWSVVAARPMVPAPRPS